MSWLGALAGGVENLLDRVDQVAGEALKDVDEPSVVEHSSTSVGGFHVPQDWPTTTRPTAIVAASAYSSFRHVSQTSPPPSSTTMHRVPSDSTSTSPNSRNAPRDPDQELFEFLNSSEVVVSKADSRPPSVGPSRSRRTPEGGHEIAPVDPVMFTSAGSQNSIMSNHISMPDISASIGSEENQLLQNEVDSLTRDVHTVSQRLQTTQEELTHCQRQLESQRRQLAQSEQTCADLRRRDADTREAIAAKDAQIAVLRTRLDEADRELAIKSKQLSDLGSTQDRTLVEQMSVSGIQRQTLDGLHEKMNDLEATLSRERDEHKRDIDEATRQHGRLEADRQSLTSEISSLQKTVNRERARSGELSAQLKTVRSQAESAKQELVDYKDKATRILQSKEKLIVSLKDGSTVSKAGGTELAVLASELESARQERDVLREQLQNTQLALESLRVETTELESQSQHDSETSRDQLTALEDQLRAERRRREDAEFDLTKQKQELRSMHEESVKQKSGFQSRIQTRDDEISRLRSQLVAKSMNASNQEELENRLRALTESLIQKQTALESLSTEKNSLIMQMERLERQCCEAESSALRAASKSVNIPDDDDGVRQRVAGFMHQSPLDGNVTRRVKMAANVIDRFGVQLGVFLRRYPVARILVIVYMGLLHLWVMIVILTYQQEIHESDYHRPLPLAP